MRSKRQAVASETCKAPGNSVVNPDDADKLVVLTPCHSEKCGWYGTAHHRDGANRMFRIVSNPDDIELRDDMKLECRIIGETRHYFEVEVVRALPASASTGPFIARKKSRLLTAAV